ncbi:hypothetical protein GGS24DRAFT_488960 [Hypoxylon argillaceum]|nr:hypothetical protein GGS24DRAFT_488960 [Hypoxylon argillaceum]
MPVKTFDVPTGAPGSPWAQRFGHLEERHQYSLVKKDDLVHSHLAPLNPNLDPRYYDVVPNSNDFEPPRSLEELDETLITEESQRIRHLGLPTWNAIALGSAVTWDGGPALLSGNRPGDDKLYDECIKKYLSERIEVDESTWFPFFRKDRWVNTNLINDRDFIVERDGTRKEVKTWSVDDERVWSIVRFSLEIANRILKAMIRDSNEW